MLLPTSHKMFKYLLYLLCICIILFNQFRKFPTDFFLQLLSGTIIYFYSYPTDGDEDRLSGNLRTLKSFFSLEIPRAKGLQKIIYLRVLSQRSKTLFKGTYP